MRTHGSLNGLQARSHSVLNKWQIHTQSNLPKSVRRDFPLFTLLEPQIIDPQQVLRYSCCVTISTLFHKAVFHYVWQGSQESNYTVHPLQIHSWPRKLEVLRWAFQMPLWQESEKPHGMVKPMGKLRLSPKDWGLQAIEKAGSLLATRPVRPSEH